jgi:methylenetetrahydrofolate dehydrogenase (NAD+)
LPASSTALITADPQCGIKVDAAVIAEPFRLEIRARVAKLQEQGFGTCANRQKNLFRRSAEYHSLFASFSTEPPLLVGLLANDDPAARQYAEWTARACRADGLRYELRHIDNPIFVEEALVAANADPAVHGIIIYYPIFGTKESFSGVSHDDYLRDTVSYQCDVEGLCHLYRTNLYRNVRYINNDLHQKCLLPCTALSVVKILEACPGVYDKSRPVKQQLAGKCIAIINRSEIVGRPVAAMLANDGATVYSIDINSIYKLEGGKVEVVSTESETVESCVRKVRERVCVASVVRHGEIVRLMKTAHVLLFAKRGVVFDCGDGGPDQELSVANRVDSTQYRPGQRGLV